MGIESDQLVYDYLSRVGDLAQQQQLPSGARMRLVATLRGEIERQRGTDGTDSPAAVRRILGRLGAPGELVSAAAGSEDGAVPLPSPRTGASPDAPEPRRVPRARLGLLRKDASGKGASRDAAPPVSTESGTGSGTAEPEGEPPAGPEPVRDWPSAAAPHMAGLAEAPSEGEPEWWRIEPGPFGEGVPGQGAMGPGTAVPGFSGGLESPELFGMPSVPKTPAPRPPVAAEEPDAAAGEEEAQPAPPPPHRRKLRLPRLRRVAVEGGAAARPRLSNPLLLLAALLLVAGAVLGSWLALAGGWLLAYSSRKFSRAEAKWVAMGLPGVVVAGAFVWLWGRMDGRWGEPLAEGAVGDAMTDVWPVVVRVAAVASALYLVWRSRRLQG
ncbi:hypothetical protein ACFVS9_07150 [Streptomyces sp. NPDC058008]|uniref:hypothetical protein n=1 Tax=Streptomyces sp. NPDC058008 TaxID=3346303 RepID=UPI0036E77229